MSTLAVPAGLAALITAILGFRAAHIARGERDVRCGSEPGRRMHVLRSDHFSVGGGETTEYHLPKDPQAGARLFVRDQIDKEHET